MKPEKRACVHPAALQLFQKLVEWKLGSRSEGGAKGGGGDGRREMPMCGAGEMAELVHGGER